jgi:hypothetical protein
MDERFSRENQLLGEIVTALRDKEQQLTTSKKELEALVLDQADELQVAQQRAIAMEARAREMEASAMAAQAEAAEARAEAEVQAQAAQAAREAAQDAALAQAQQPRSSEQPPTTDAVAQMTELRHRESELFRELDACRAEILRLQVQCLSDAGRVKEARFGQQEAISELQGQVSSFLFLPSGLPLLCPHVSAL